LASRTPPYKKQSVPAGDLDGEMADAARCADDKHAAVCGKRAVGRQASQRYQACER
jgi:hypothetical protein